MAILDIKDLHANEAQDRHAMKAVRGGRMSFGWIRPYTEQSGASPVSVFIGQIQVYNYALINPVFNSVNQVEYISVDASQVVDSSVQISVRQGQDGFAG
jgi:hypothetical protein